MFIYPVVVSIPNCVHVFDRKYSLPFTRLFAVEAVMMSSRKSGLGVSLDQLSKDERGAPLQCDGVYWSLTHKRRYAGGVVASGPVGIDIEEVLTRPVQLCCKIAELREWNLGAGDREKLFYRYWTAKEAVLKAECVGLPGLSNCSVDEVIDDVSMIVSYDVNKWCVGHIYFDGHVAAVASNNFDLDWVMRK